MMVWAEDGVGGKWRRQKGPRMKSAKDGVDREGQ